jgi:hypothetical protein
VDLEWVTERCAKEFSSFEQHTGEYGSWCQRAFPKISEAMDGRREAQMGEASVYEAKLHAQPNDSNL